MRNIFISIILGFIFLASLVGLAESSMSVEDGGPLEVEPQTWVEIQSAGPVISVCGHMVYDSESDVTILFGGFDGAKPGSETWAYDYKTNTWTNKTPDPSPPGRVGLGLIYDPSRDICILFGGIGAGQAALNDTWKYDYNTNTWTELHPTVSPSPRGKGGATYDIESDQIVWFGGYGNDGVLLDETWTYNYDDNTWVNRTSGVRPPARKRNPLIYDEESDVVIMFCGWLGGDEVLGDLWAYDFNTNTWTELDYSAPPHKRCRYGRAYDPKRDVIIYTHGFGGEDGDLDDTWTYDYNTNTWTEVNMLNTPPSKRHCFQIALDTEHDVIIFQGGNDGINAYSDSWAFKPYEAESENGDDALMTLTLIAAGCMALVIIIAIAFYLKKK